MGVWFSTKKNSLPSRSSKVGRKVALGVAVAVLALGLGLRAAGVEFSAESVARAVREAGTASWGPVVFFGLYVVLTSVALPSVMLHIAGGVLWGFWPGVLINVVCANLVSNLQFWAGRLFGAGPLRSAVEKRGIAKHFEKARTEGLWIMLGLRQLPLPAVVVNVAAGASAMPWWHFVVGSGLCGLVPQLIWTWFAGEVFHDPTAVRSSVLIKAAAAGAGALLIAFGSRAVARKLAARAGAPPA